jgi:hypothetical protein
MSTISDPLPIKLAPRRFVHIPGAIFDGRSKDIKSIMPTRTLVSARGSSQATLQQQASIQKLPGFSAIPPLENTDGPGTVMGKFEDDTMSDEKTKEARAKPSLTLVPTLELLRRSKEQAGTNLVSRKTLLTEEMLNSPAELTKTVKDMSLHKLVEHEVLAMAQEEEMQRVDIIKTECKVRTPI